MSAPNGNGEDHRLASEILVPSTDPKKADDKPKANGDAKGKGKGDEKDQPDIVSSSPEILRMISMSQWLMHQSEEDLQLQAELEMLVERLKVSSLSQLLARIRRRPVIVPQLIKTGKRHRLVPSCSRVPAKPYTDKHEQYDECAQAAQIPQTAL